MSSPSSHAHRPQGAHRAPRKGSRVLTGRSIRVVGTRRTELELHHLGRALLRLAQEHYDASQTGAALAPQEADTAATAATVGPGRTSGLLAPLARETGVMG